MIPKHKKEDLLKYVENIILIQDILIRQTSETRGIRDKSGIMFSAMKILNLKSQKADPFEIAAVIYDEFARKHFFHEGNKRIANILANAELLLAGYSMEYQSNQDGDFIRNLSQYNSPVTREEIVKWLKSRSHKIQ